MKVVFSTMLAYFFRTKIWIVLILLFLLSLLATMVVGSLGLVDEGRVVINFFLGAMELVALWVVVFFAAHTIFYERKSSTLYLLWSKRFDSSYIIIGKFLAFVILLLLCYLLFAVGFLFLIYRYDISLAQPLFVLISFVLGFFKLVLLLSVVLLFAVWMMPFLTIILSLGVYFIGHSLHFLYYYISNTPLSPFMKTLFAGVFYLFPHFDLGSLKEFIFVESLYSGMDLLMIFVQYLLYTVLFIGMACFVFARYKKKGYPTLVD